MNSKKLSVIYVLIHGFFWCTYAVTWSYTAMYLKSCGYENSIVGLVTGIGAVISIVLQPVMASMTSKVKFMNNRSNILILKIASIIIGAIMMIKFPGVYTAAVLFTFAVAIDASIPSILSCVAMDSVNSGLYINYGAARGGGSVIFAGYSLMLGFLIQWFGVGCLMPLYIVTGIATVALVAAFMKCYDRKIQAVRIARGGYLSENDVQLYERQEFGNSAKNKSAGTHFGTNTKKTSMFNVIGKYPFLKWFLLSAIFLFMGHNMINVFMLNIIENAGGSSANLGLSLAIAAGIELPVMLCYAGISQKIPTGRLLIISAVCFTVKSVFTCFADNLVMVYIAQLMQFGAFAVFTPASVYYINQKMSREDSGLGQALLGSCSLGLGGTLGNIIGGIVIDSVGLKGMLICASVLSAIGIIFMAAGTRKNYKQKQTKASANTFANNCMQDYDYKNIVETC